jgi:peptidoglycan hydrolase-like protein with peptidoglycan-binding domain
MSHAQWSDEETGLVLPFAEGGDSEQGFDGLEEPLEATPFAEYEDEAQANPNIERFLSGPTLRRGASGIDVTMLQQGLQKAGHPAPLNGKFDAATERAVREFQRKSGLTPDGVVGRLTKLALIRALGKPIPPTPPIRPKRKGNTAKGRLVVDQHPMIQPHGKGTPHLVLRWNDISQSGAVDVVFHFHGFSGHKQGMRLDAHKESISGLDFADPADNDVAGRSRPTIGVLPRGRYYGGKSGAGFDFPALTKPGVVRALVQDALVRVGTATGHSLSLGRLILTGHSGGGAPIGAVIADADPDEVQVFDGTYGSGKAIAEWAKRRIQRELASPTATPPALRVLYRPGTQTEAQAKYIANAICPALHGDAAAALRTRFRVDGTRVGHNEIPAVFGWRLLLDAGADLPDASTVPCAHGRPKRASREAESQFEHEYQFEDTEDEAMAVQDYAPSDEDFDANEDYIFGEDREGLAWMDVEAESTSMLEGEYEFEEEDEAQYEEEHEREFEGEFEGHYEYEAEDEGYLFEESAEAEYDIAMEAFEQLLDAEYEGEGFIEAIKGIAAFVIGPNLKRGSKGPGVETLQRLLTQLGYPVAVKGIFGPKTESAVRKFQAAEGISVDGICGPQTRRAMADAIKRRGSPPKPAPQPTPTPVSTSQLADNIVRIAKQERERWHNPVAIKEWQPAAKPILTEYYKVGLGWSLPKDYVTKAWSAVFISYVMRKAGAGNLFDYFSAHRKYVATAYQNRLSNNTGNPFWAYKPDEVAPQLGDLICNWRGKFSDTTIENVNDKKERFTHCDIVVDVQPGKLTAIGGNVPSNVDRKTIYTLPDGRIDLNSTKRKQSAYIAVVRCRGPIGSVTPTPTPTPPAPVPPTPTHVPGQKLKPAEFVATFGPSARASQAKHGVPALVTLGQAALESGWGAKAAGFNFFGIKARESDPEHTRQLWKTREVKSTPNEQLPRMLGPPKLRPDGKYDYFVEAWFRKYPSSAAAFDDHGAMLVRVKHYRKAFDYKHDPYAFADAIAKPYATDPNYAKVLKNVMKMIENAGGG